MTGERVRLLVSVRDESEAAAAVEGGADIVDVKEPANGAMGMATPETIRRIIDIVGGARPVSAAMGELREHDLPPPLPAPLAFVKVGLAGARDDWQDTLAMFFEGRLNSMDRSRADRSPGSGHTLHRRGIAVAYADAARAGAPPVERVLAWSVEHRAAGLLIDTAVKDGRGLFEWLDVVTLRGLVAVAGEADLLIALAGSLSDRSFEQAVALGPDIVAVRGAACKGRDRQGRVDVDQVKALSSIVQGTRPIVRPIHNDGRVQAVVAGCRREDGRWLLIRRSKHVHAAPGKVCFPGGAIELGESQRDAVIREYREEIGVEIEPLRCVWHHAYHDKDLTLFAWLATLKSSQIRPNPAEVEQVMWLATDEAATHVDALPFHDQIVAALQAAVDQMAAEVGDELRL